MKISKFLNVDKSNGHPNYINTLRKGIWLYYFLLIFEGALRKWVFPSLASPLLVIRDPVVIVLILIALKHNILRLNGFLLVITLIGLIGFIAALTAGHGNLVVALYGVRILLLHFPLMFIMQRVLTKEDILQFGRVTIYLAIPMALLITYQFYSPQSAWVNRGVGGDEEGAGFSGAMGFFRPPGTFSFTNGNSLFFGLVGAYTLYFWFVPKSLNKIILIIATTALIVSIPISISRALFFQVCISLIFALIVVLRKPKYAGTAIISALLIVLLFTALSTSSFFGTAISAFTKRFEMANKSEGGIESVLLDRYLGGLISALKFAFDKPFFGLGIGAGTNVGSTLLVGESRFLAGEGEWGRLVAEIGPVMGILVIIVRLGLSFEVAFGSYKKLVKGDTLPWMLISFGLLILPQGGWAQPTSLGFCTLVGGFLLAAINPPTNFRKYIFIPQQPLQQQQAHQI